MTMPGYAQSPALRTTAPTRPGMRPANTGPTRGTPQNAFAQALSQANTQSLVMRNQLSLAAASAPAATGAPVPGQNGMPAELQSMAGIFRPIAAQGPATLQIPGGFGPMVSQAAKKYGVDPALIAAVMETESRFNPDAVSQAGARGLMQLMPATARGLGVTDANDPLQNILGGAKLLGQLSAKYNGNIELTLAAYNAGSGAVDKHGGIPPYAETRKYVPLVLSAYERFRTQTGAAASVPSATGR